MSCCYSNLIEGRNTHPPDIDRALHHEYSAVPKRRALQLEAVAHIESQQAIDGRYDSAFPASTAYTLWFHWEFRGRLPDELFNVDDPESKYTLCFGPGVLRKAEVPPLRGTCRDSFPV
jgi:hypothetical protein